MKNLVALAVVLGFSACNRPSTGTTAGALAQASDCNGDGVVNAQDLQVVVNAVLGTPSACADVNHDGTVNTQDVQAMLNQILAGPQTPGQFQWAAVQTSGSTFASGYLDWVMAVAADSAGNVFASGPTQGNYLFINKYSPSGDALWNRTFYGGSAQPHALVTDEAGSVYVTGFLFGSRANLGGQDLVGNAQQTLFVAKYSAAGDHLWSVSYPGRGDSSGMGIALDHAGHVVVTGSFYTLDFGAGPVGDLWPGTLLAKQSAADGSLVSAKRYEQCSGGGCVYGHAVAVAANDDILLLSACPGNTDFGGGPIASASNTGVGTCLVKLTSAMAPIWSKYLATGTPLLGANDGPQSMALAPNGDIVLTGGFAGTTDFGGGPLTAPTGDIFFARYSSSGAYLWAKSVGGSAANDDAGFATATDRDGNMLFTGGVMGAADFGTGSLSSPTTAGTFVAKYSPTGTCLWSHLYGTGQSGHGIAADPADNVLVAGSWHGTVDLGGGPLASNGTADDGFVLEVLP